MTEDEIRKAVIEHTIRSIQNYIDDEMSAEDALANIATMIEVRGLNDFGDGIERPPPP